MAQLSDDCFAFSGPLMPLEEMERLISERVVPVSETETVPLSEARGRILAADVISPVNLPPFRNSAVDGYAVRFSDLKTNGETQLVVSGRLQAGSASDQAVGAGKAVRIFTGAPMPQDADTVFMQEDVQVHDGTATVPAGLKRGANTREAGEDLRAGAVALPEGRFLDAQHIGLAAAIGLTKLNVRRPLRVAVFSTGNEVVEPGRPLPQAAIYDANRYLLGALLERLGCIVSDLGILKDDPASLLSGLREAARAHDLVLTSGGVSTGEADHVRAAVESAGTLVFWRVAIKPGRPVAMGVIRGGNDHSAVFAGLPGNPVAAFVTFVRVVRPLLLRLGGALPSKLRPMPVIAGFAYRKKTGRREYVRVSLRRRADGDYEAIKHPQDGAGILTSLTETDGLLELLDDTTEVKPGERVGFLSYSALMG
jgi:molybdopterin molybdotransferase